MSEFPAWLAATLASDATDGQGVLPLNILPLRPDSRVVGRARAVLMSQDDNLSVRNILETFTETPPAPGTVLVAAGGSASRTATIGGLMALELRQAGIAGLVTDGLIRDSGEIRQLGFDVWCRGVTPTASRKNGPVVVGGAVSLGGVVITDGDLVIADADGVVIWPKDRIATLLSKAEAKYQQDTARLARLRGEP
jgi:regulator of RNase E activity RraA